MWLEKAERLVWIVFALSFLTVVGMRINNNSAKDVQIYKGEDKERIKVSVTGEVQNSGEYMVEYGARVCDVLYCAGGVTENADVELVDLDARVVEGTRIVVPSVDEEYRPLAIYIVNINTADSAELMSISGVGETIAQRIVEYRKNSGGFDDIADIMNVPGIGQKTFEKIKDYIKVN